MPLHSPLTMLPPISTILYIRQGVVDHHERRGRHEHLRTSHRNDGCGRGGNAVDFYCDVAVVVHEELFINTGNTSATGMVTSEGFVVLKGAVVNEKTSAKSLVPE